MKSLETECVEAAEYNYSRLPLPAVDSKCDWQISLEDLKNIGAWDPCARKNEQKKYDCRYTQTKFEHNRAKFLKKFNFFLKKLKIWTIFVDFL